VIELGGITIGQVQNPPSHRSAQEAENLASIAGIAFGAHTKLVVTPVITIFQDGNAFFDGLARQLQPALVGVE